MKPVKRDYVDGAELWDTEAVLAQLSGWIEDYNTRAPHSALTEPGRLPGGTHRKLLPVSRTLGSNQLGAFPEGLPDGRPEDVHGKGLGEHRHVGAFSEACIIVR